MIEPQDKKEIEKMIDLKTRRSYEKRVGDTPNDALQLLPKKFVCLATSTDDRPASITGTMTRFFFNTTDEMPWWYSPVSSVWVDAVGSTVASN